MVEPGHLPMARAFASGPGDQVKISGQVIAKTQEKVLDSALLNTQHYKVRIKGNVEQSREWNCALPLYLGLVTIEKGAFGSPSTKVDNFTYFTYSRWYAIKPNKTSLSLSLYIYIYIYIYIKRLNWYRKTIKHIHAPLQNIRIFNKEKKRIHEALWIKIYKFSLN